MNLLEEPFGNVYGHVTIAEYGGWLVKICPMIFNDRVTLFPMDDPYMPHYGWCFPKGGAALLAVMAWDPETEGEPRGYIKSTNGTRRAGEHYRDDLCRMMPTRGCPPDGCQGLPCARFETDDELRWLA